MDADAAYPILFSHPSFVEGLFRLIPELAAEQLDFSTFQRENIKHHHQDLARKEGDLALWFRYLNGQEVEMLILWELQSAIDPRMPLRLWESWMRACKNISIRRALKGLMREFIWHGPVQGRGLLDTKEQLEEMMEDPNMSWDEKFRGWEHI